MLRSINSIEGFDIQAKNGSIGEMEEFLFDDTSWEIRYLVVNTGDWLIDRLVLISPVALGSPDWETEKFPVFLRKEQIENSPNMEKEKPVSRQMQAELHEYYGWPGYVYAPFPAPKYPKIKTEKAESNQEGDPHLRSTAEVEGYHIQAIDDEIGHVEDFIIDDKEWLIRYIVVDTRNWLPGKKVLVTPRWIQNIDWIEEKVFVDLKKEEVKNSPEYDPTTPINREYEIRLYDYYGRPKYWER